MNPIQSSPRCAFSERSACALGEFAARVRNLSKRLARFVRMYAQRPAFRESLDFGREVGRDVLLGFSSLVKRSGLSCAFGFLCDDTQCSSFALNDKSAEAQVRRPVEAKRHSSKPRSGLGICGRNSDIYGSLPKISLERQGREYLHLREHSRCEPAGILGRS